MKKPNLRDSETSSGDVTGVLELRTTGSEMPLSEPGQEILLEVLRFSDSSKEESKMTELQRSRTT